MENSLVDTRADTSRFCVCVCVCVWRNIQKGLYIVTLQQRSGYTADHFPTEHPNMYSHAK